jgi:hypothetical protein
LGIGLTKVRISIWVRVDRHSDTSTSRLDWDGRTAGLGCLADWIE